MMSVVLGFDFGQKKIGLAVGQLITRTASPLGIIKARDGVPDWESLDKLVKKWAPTQLVVGLPLNMDASVSDMARAAEKFARRLEGRYHLEVCMMDERLSTFDARQRVQSEGDIDDIAASLILETWLAQQPGPRAG